MELFEKRQISMRKVKLSFCIPTYNRAQLVYELVVNILLCLDSEIEVVVLDNGSTDDTLTLLNSIQDARLTVYTNGENKGGLFNVVNVINKAQGEYILFITDKDQIDFNEVTKFKIFLLQHPGLASGFCEFNSNSGIEYEVFNQGYNAVKNIAYKGRHPTGYFFNNVLLKSINHVENFSDYKIVDMFPFEFIHAELCLLGNGAIYHVPMFTLETEKMAAKYKSYNASGKSKEAFFSPEARLKLAINYTKHINTLCLTYPEKKTLIIDILFQQIGAATVGYRSILRNKNICAHYYMECKELKIKELFNIGAIFYTKYRVKTIDLWGNNFFTKMTFELYIFRRLMMKTVKHLILASKRLSQ